MSATANQDLADGLAHNAYEYGKRVSMNVNEQDKQLWALVSDVPFLEGPYPYLCAILNILLPGSGTIIATCMAGTESWSKT